MKSRAWALRSLLVLCSVAVTLLLAEIVARVHTYRSCLRDRHALEQLGRSVVRPRSDGNTPLHGLLRPSSDERRIYELIPRLSVKYLNQPVEVNALGFRGPPVAQAKPAGVRRLIGLGDSIQFGWGVRYEDTYLARLSARLNAPGATSRWEVINTGVPGYNTAMELVTLEDRALALGPDVVVLDFCINDFSLPNFIEAEPDVWSLRECFLGRYVGPPKAHFDKRHWEMTSAGFTHSPWNKDRTALEDDPRRVPSRYRSLVGTNSVVRALGRLKDLEKPNGFRAIVVSFARVPDVVRQTCARLDLPLVTCEDAIEQYGRAHGDSLAAIYIPHDGHPTAEGHRLAAEVYYEALRRFGMIP